MKKLLLTIFLALFITSNSYAEYRKTLPKSSIVCFKKQSFEDLKTAIYNDDSVGYKYLMQSECISSKAGIKISVLDTSFFGNYAKIRLYSKRITIVGWTFLKQVIVRTK